MKDIDFDELDKAVNSLMATSEPAPAAEPVMNEASAVPVSVAPAPVVVSKEPVAEPDAQSPVAVTVPVVSRPAPVMPAARRGGRFMDMVHTSSDMKPATAPASREGLSIAPRDDTVSPAPVAQEPVAPDPIPSIMPDPIDMASVSTDMEPATVAPVVEVVPEQQPAPESPFIADAKVDKRPLNPGTSSSEETLESILNGPDDSPDLMSENTPAESNHDDEPPAVPQIPELSSDLVAIESNEKVETSDVSDSSTLKVAESSAPAPAATLGAASIAQQYTQQPSTGDQSHAAIYDASQYPEPVAHPAKKKSGWLWVVWVILLLGVGAGGAVVLYNLGII
jgi:hypothetical protein